MEYSMVEKPKPILQEDIVETVPVLRMSPHGPEAVDKSVAQEFMLTVLFKGIEIANVEGERFNVIEQNHKDRACNLKFEGIPSRQ